MRLSPHLSGALLSLAAFSVFASYDALVKALGASLPTLQVLFMACAFSLPVMLAKAWHAGDRGSLRPANPWLMTLRVGVIILNGVVVTHAFAVLPLATCYAIFFTMPILIPLLAWPLLGERIDLWRGAMIVLGFGGVVYALDPGQEPLTLAHLGAVAGAVLAAVNYIIIRKIGRDERPFVMQFWPVVGQIAALAPLMPFVAQRVSLGQTAVTAVMGVAAVAGMALIIQAYARAPAIIVAPMQYAQILWAALFGALFFDETLSLRMIIGMAVIILAGLALLARPARASA